MLVLSRRIGQTIVIADGIRVSVISIQGEKVRLGIEAPRSIQVDREEVAARRHSGPDMLSGAEGMSTVCVTPSLEAKAPSVTA